MPWIQSSDDSAKLDVEVFFPGDKFPVVVGPILRSTKWRGGLWVMYVTGDQDFTVEVSDGTLCAGFLMFSSEWADPSTVGGPSDFISYQPATQIGGQNVMTMVNGGTRAFWKEYETQRIVAGARTGADITYILDEPVKISENGLLCNDSDGDLATVGITSPIVVGIVSAVPSDRNVNRLGADIKY
ncbi:hypothetical protein N9917_01035 [Deltaproteobacteria bacterium]|nr:hypothetical protein [Deltaproteobacteria bacterium]